MTTNTTPRPGPADEALLAAEREITELWRKQAALRTAGDKEDHLEISNKAFALDDYVAKLKPDSLIGAAVKLRRLADPHVGMETGESEHDIKSLRHILAVVERSISPAGEIAEKQHDEEEADPRNTLETAICDIGSIADILRVMGTPRGNWHLCYLGAQLAEHQELADDAFNRIYGLGQYASAEQKASRGGAA